jgi:hypothetical protein
MFKKVVTLTNPAREFWLATCVGRLFNTINTLSMIISGSLISHFLIYLLNVLPFLLLLNLLVTSIKTFTRRRRRKGRRSNERRRKRVNMRLMFLGWRDLIRSTKDHLGSHEWKKTIPVTLWRIRED